MASKVKKSTHPHNAKMKSDTSSCKGISIYMQTKCLLICIDVYAKSTRLCKCAFYKNMA